MDRPHPLIFAVWGLAACDPEAPLDEAHPGAQLAAGIASATAATGEGFGDPRRAIDGVRGGGRFQGGLDVYAIGPGTGDELVLGFERPVRDGDGPDLVVFENPFEVRGGGWFIDPVVVEVSADCEAFVAFPHAFLGEPGVWLADPSAWSGFAGLTPVQLHEEEEPVDPLGPDAGGDAFDLAELDDADIAADGVRCVRLTAASAHDDPATGAPYPADPISNGPDIDGVYGRSP